MLNNPPPSISPTPVRFGSIIVTVKRTSNTSGLLYKEKHLKETLPLLSETEMLALLAEDGMLVKRPMLIGDDFVLVGFKKAVS